MICTRGIARLPAHTLARPGIPKRRSSSAIVEFASISKFPFYLRRFLSVLFNDRRLSFSTNQPVERGLSQAILPFLRRNDLGRLAVNSFGCRMLRSSKHDRSVVTAHTVVTSHKLKQKYEQSFFPPSLRPGEIDLGTQAIRTILQANSTQNVDSRHRPPREWSIMMTCQKPEPGSYQRIEFRPGSAIRHHFFCRRMRRART